jgi:hypothetical protein
MGDIIDFDKNRKSDERLRNIMKEIISEDKTKVVEKPKPLEKTDPEKFFELKRQCQEYIDYIGSEEYNGEEGEYVELVFERAVELFFGNDAWNYVTFILMKDQ